MDWMDYIGLDWVVTTRADKGRCAEDTGCQDLSRCLGHQVLAILAKCPGY